MSKADMSPEAILEMWRIDSEEGLVPQASEEMVLNIFAASTNLEEIPGWVLDQIPQMESKGLFPPRVKRYVDETHKRQALRKASFQLAEKIAIMCGVKLSDTEHWRRHVASKKRVLGVLYDPYSYHVPKHVRAVQEGPITILSAPIQVTVGAVPLLAVRYASSSNRNNFQFQVLDVKFLERGDKEYSKISLDLFDDIIVATTIESILIRQGMAKSGASIQ